MSVEVCKDDGPSVLIVEGKDDCNGIYHLAKQHSLQHLFGIYAGSGDKGALERFGGLLLAGPTKRPTTMGLVLDCDPADGSEENAAQRRWDQIKGRLEPLGYVVPRQPSTKGAVLDGPKDLPKVGIWLMPNNDTSGMFEDFLLLLAPAEAVQFAEACVRTARQANYGDYKLVHESKAIAHTYLAWQDEPGKPLGLAVKTGKFDSNKPECQVFMQWLLRTFGPR